MWNFDENEWLLIACAFTALASLPLALRMVPPNRLYGFRTRFTRSSPAVWYPANAFAGRLMFAGSIFSAMVLLYLPGRLQIGWIPIAIVTGPIALATFAGWVYLRHLRESAVRR